MHSLLFAAQVFLVVVTAALLAALVHALLARTNPAIPTDLSGGDQPARGAEHHDNKHVLHAQLALDEEGGEGFGSGVVNVFHGADSFARH